MCQKKKDTVSGTRLSLGVAALVPLVLLLIFSGRGYRRSHVTLLGDPEKCATAFFLGTIPPREGHGQRSIVGFDGNDPVEVITDGERGHHRMVPGDYAFVCDGLPDSDIGAARKVLGAGRVRWFPGVDRVESGIVVAPRLRDYLASVSVARLLDQAVSEKVEIPEVGGAFLLQDIDRGSLLEMIGVRNGDVLVAVGEERVDGLLGAIAAIRIVSASPSYVVRLIRGRRPLSFTVSVAVPAPRH